MLVASLVLIFVSCYYCNQIAGPIIDQVVEAAYKNQTSNETDPFTPYPYNNDTQKEPEYKDGAADEGVNMYYDVEVEVEVEPVAEDLVLRETHSSHHHGDYRSKSTFENSTGKGMPPHHPGSFHHSGRHGRHHDFDFSNMTPEQADSTIKMFVAHALMIAGIVAILFQFACCGLCIFGINKFKKLQKENEAFMITDPRGASNSAMVFPKVASHLLMNNQLSISTDSSYETREIPRGTAINS